MVFRNVIVCRMVPGSEQKVADVFGHYDNATRPQDFGVIGRILLSLDDLYIHIVERKEDPAVSGQTRGLPAFQKIAEELEPYVTPYPSNWQNPSDSVAKEFYSWSAQSGSAAKAKSASKSKPASGSAPGTANANVMVIVQRVKPDGAEEVARIFRESDAGSLPDRMGVLGRWLYMIDDVYVHLMERTDEAVAEGYGGKHHHAEGFAEVMEKVSAFASPYNPEKWSGPGDSMAKQFYRWKASD